MRPTKNISQLPLCLWPPTWQGSDMQWGAPTHKVIWCFSNLLLWGYVKNLIHYISTSTTTMATKHGKVVTYCERFPLIKPHDPLITWSYELMWLIEYIIFPPVEDLFHRSCKIKLKALYIHYHNAKTDHQTSKGGYLVWGAPTHIVTWRFDHVVLWIIWQTKNIVSSLPQCLCPPNLEGWLLRIT